MNLEEAKTLKLDVMLDLIYGYITFIDNGENALEPQFISMTFLKAKFHFSKPGPGLEKTLCVLRKRAL